MAIDREAIGKTYPPFEYEVGREKVREYALAVGEENQVHLDREAARAAGFRDIVAPPMFAAVYSAGAVWPAYLDPEVGVNFSRMVHGAQEFFWDEPVCCGDTITTTVSVKDIREQGERGFYLFESLSRNQDDRQVARGLWLTIVREG